MGTSNWQNIPFCVEVLMKIAPQRVLDVGVGFGRWGMIVREFCDVWYGRVFKSQWSVHIEGIEAFADNISDYHHALYDQIHLGDAREIIPSLDSTWDVVIFGDVLEHFERHTGEALLNWSLDHAEYVLVNIPLGSEWPQSELYENPYEEHLSTWIEMDFGAFGLCRKALFVDYIDRPFGSFVLSRSDPKKLSESLFSKATHLTSKFSEDHQGMDNIYTQALQLRNEQLYDELNFIKNSRSYRLIERMKSMPFAPLLVKLAKLMIPDGQPANEKPGVALAIQSQATLSGLADKQTVPHVLGHTENSQLLKTRSDQVWAELQIKNPTPLSINQPEWKGILASASGLFDNIYFVPDNLDEQRARYYAELFSDAKPPSITIQGFPISYYHLVKEIKKIAPRIPIFAIWHGNFLHTKEDYDWASFRLLKALYEDGDIAKVGFVKKGMAEVMASTGIKSAFIMNIVRRIPDAPSRPLAGGYHIGIWGQPDWSWKKPPYAMLASLKLVPKSVGHLYYVSLRAEEFGRLMNIKAEYHFDPVPQAQVQDTLVKMHVNLYVTLSECAPMLPLESLSMGSPCLLGPTSHYFIDHDYLYKRLVVPFPDNAETIAQYTKRSLEERDEIISAYRDYAPVYNQRALEALANFLEYPITSLNV